MAYEKNLLTATNTFDIRRIDHFNRELDQFLPRKQAPASVGPQQNFLRSEQPMTVPTYKPSNPRTGYYGNQQVICGSYPEIYKQTQLVYQTRQGVAYVNYQKTQAAAYQGSGIEYSGKYQYSK